jgi:predicted dienelactone hydrolase
MTKARKISSWGRRLSRIKRIALLVTGLLPLLLVENLLAADRIQFRYGLWSQSLAVRDLETFVATGDIHGSLSLVLSRLSPDQQQQLRDALQAQYDVDPVTVSRFSYTASGEQLLQEAGHLLQTPSGQNGWYGLRAALVLAADDPEGLTLMNLLRQLPTDIQIELTEIADLLGRFTRLIGDTQQTIDTLKQTTQAIAPTAPLPNLNHIADLQTLGSLRVSRQTLTLYDAERDRTLTTDLYLPNQAEPAPVIMVSNGLGARRDRFVELAEYLASHGFAVVIPDHPGSDRQRLQEFYQGLHRENFEATEFIDRPLDISFVLDELEQLNAQISVESSPVSPSTISIDLSQRLNLSQVGIFGYSFGGTTALSLAGAVMDQAHLERDCATQPAIVNISLLYQCRALELTDLGRSLRDPRIQAAYVFVPFGKSLFGPDGLSQVETPIFWEATDQDVLTPLVIEQTPAFGWLTTPERYLTVSNGLPHARLTLDVINRLTGQATTWETVKPITLRYQNVMSTAFFKVYVAQDDAYLPYLTAAYVQDLTVAPYTLTLVRSLP